MTAQEIVDVPPDAVIHHGWPKLLHGKEPDLNNVELEAACGEEGGFLTLGWERVNCPKCRIVELMP